MKKILCYLAIFIILFLIILPPGLRMFLKDEKDDKKETNIENQSLYCQSQKYTILASYTNNEYQNIIIKKINKIISQNDTDSEEEINDSEEFEFIQEENTALDELFNTLKENEELEYKQLDDGEVISIDFSNNIVLDDAIKKFDSAKDYLEKMALKCDIR